jgi:hypothetical protein
MNFRCSEETLIETCIKPASNIADYPLSLFPGRSSKLAFDSSGENFSD